MTTARRCSVHDLGVPPEPSVQCPEPATTTITGPRPGARAWPVCAAHTDPITTDPEENP